jgi:hypothetical protein
MPTKFLTGLLYRASVGAMVWVSGLMFTSALNAQPPRPGTWTSTGNLNQARSRHTSTLLSNGLVLMAGGQ